VSIESRGYRFILLPTRNPTANRQHTLFQRILLHGNDLAHTPITGRNGGERKCGKKSRTNEHKDYKEYEEHRPSSGGLECFQERGSRWIPQLVLGFLVVLGVLDFFTLRHVRGQKKGKEVTGKL